MQSCSDLTHRASALCLKVEILNSFIDPGCWIRQRKDQHLLRSCRGLLGNHSSNGEGEVDTTLSRSIDHT